MGVVAGFSKLSAIVGAAAGAGITMAAAAGGGTGGCMGWLTWGKTFERRATMAVKTRAAPQG